MEYPIVETFFGIQGEGLHVGRPVNFIRLAGCPIDCEFCDTDKEVKERVQDYDLVSRMKEGFPVVITGGEPCIHDLAPLTGVLYRKSFPIYLETSGAFPITGSFSYIAVSPKKTHHFTKRASEIAHEVKWLVPLWTLEEIQVLSKFFVLVNDFCITRHFIQPVNDFRGINSQNVKLAIEVATALKWSISIQMHKVIHVR